MHWRLSHRCDPVARAIADRHYNRQHVGAKGFVPPGRCLVLLSTDATALWVTSWPYAEFVKHAWPGAWINSLFRREGGDVVASQLIREAVAATRWRWPDIPTPSMVSFVDADKVKHKRDPGRCYIKAGFKLVGKTASGLLAFQMEPADMPAAKRPTPAVNSQVELWTTAR